jgi:hypothetical protein
MQHCIVLDKSYLQSVSAQRIRELSVSAELVMTDALFYELLTTDAVTRARCFAKFPATENPVRIVGHIGPMLLHEKSTNTKSMDFLSYEIAERYRFNKALCDVDYQMPQDAVEHTKEETDHIHGSIERFVSRTEAAISIFPLVMEGSDSARLEALYEYERDVATPENILTLYRNIDDPALPPHSLLTEDWATFRLYQISLLFSLHTLHRHRGPVPSNISAREFVRLEHDVHDSGMLLTAAMAGGLATKEAKLLRWWQLLFPTKPFYSR